MKCYFTFQTWQSGDPVVFQAETIRSASYAMIKHTTIYPYKFFLKIQPVLSVPTTMQLDNWLDTDKSCAIMILENLARPQWMFVECNKTLLEHFFCFKRDADLIDMNTGPDSVFVCRTGHIKHLRSCVSVSWMSAQHLHNTKSIYPNTHELFSLLFSSIHRRVSPPVFLSELQSVTFFYSVLNKVMHWEHSGQDEKQQVLVGHSHPDVQLTEFLGGNVLLCNKSVVISAAHVACDVSKLIVKHIHTRESLDLNEKQQSGLDLNFKTCPKTFFLSFFGVCVKFVLQLRHWVWAKETDLLHTRLENDNSESENTRSAERNCDKQGHLSCASAMNVCYNFSQICSYSVDEANNIIPCRGGEHLQNCTMFECNMMSKCPSFYCIPFRSVCDANWDCPLGTDEQHCWEFQKCTNMFKCHGTMACIHLGDVCNKVNDCKNKDDEALCILYMQKCPKECQCSGLTILCSTGAFHDKMMFSLEQPYDSIEILDMSSVAHLHLNFSYLSTASATRCCLKSCVVFWNSKELKFLNLSHNCMKELHNQCFSQSPKLMVIIVRNNQIQHVKMLTFVGLKRIQILDLSNNCFSTMLAFSDLELHTLQVLSIQNNTFENLKENIFVAVYIGYLQTGETFLCCFLSPDSQCSAEVPWYFGCTGLLPNLGIKISIYVVSTVIFLANIISIVLQVMSGKKSKNLLAFAVTVQWINVSDLTCSVTLIILWIADILYGVSFVYNDSNWRSSTACHIIFAAALNFFFLHPLLLSFLSYSRYEAVRKPVKTFLLDHKSILKWLIIFTVASMLLSSGLTFATWITADKHQLPFFLCSPFIDPAASVALVDILTWVTSVISSGSSIFVFVVYIKLFLSLKSSKNTQKGKISGEKSTRTLLYQLVIVTASNILCWIPTSVVYLTLTYLDKYPVDILIWTFVVVTPTNSFVNPVVFIVTTLRKITK